MNNEKNLIKLEKEIRGKMLAIKNGKLTPKESGIGKMMNIMKSLDEPLYIELIEKYKEILKNR
jgi:hypothetical protein